MTTINTKITKDIADRLDDKIDGLTNWLPAKIVSYDAATSTASVKPLINVSDGKGGFVEIPVIPSVKVARYACGNFTFKLPFKEGDIIRLVFTNVGLEGFEGARGLKDEDLASKNSLTNCFAIPSEYSSETSSFEVTATGELNIKMQTKITLEAGTVKILSNISDQLGKVSQALQALSGAVVTVPAFNTPTPLTVAPSLTSTTTQLNALKSQLDQVI